MQLLEKEQKIKILQKSKEELYIDMIKRQNSSKFKEIEINNQISENDVMHRQLSQEKLDSLQKIEEQKDINNELAN